MSTETVIVNDGIDLSVGPLIHGYPIAYMQKRHPQIGDVALCGHIKNIPYQGIEKQWGESGVCIVCEELRKNYV